MNETTPKRGKLPSADYLHRLSDDGLFHFDEPPGDGIPAPDTTIPRLPDMSGLDTQHPERRFRIRASDTYVRNIATEINAPSIVEVFEKTKDVLKGTRYTRVEVTEITLKKLGVKKR